MSAQKQVLSIEALEAADACEPGMEWITPLIEQGDEQAVIDALHRHHPTWAQWALAHGFNVKPSSDEFGWDDERGTYFQTSGYGSTQTAGYGSTQTAGDCSTQTAGHGSTQTAGDCSTQTAGYGSTQAADALSTQTAGYGSTQTAGRGSTQKAGAQSRFRVTEAPGVFVCLYVEKSGVWKMACILCDGKKIKPNVFYTFDTEDETWKEAADQSEPAS